MNSKVCRETLQPLLWPISAVLVVAPPALSSAVFSISLAMAEHMKDKTNCSLDSAGELNLFLFAKPSGCSNAWEYTKLGGFLQDLQIHKVLLMSCMQHVERNGEEKQIQPQPAPEGCPQLQYSLPSKLSEESLERD